MLTLQLDDIVTSTNIRNEVGDISGLVSSIERHGLLQAPLVVLNRDTEKYQLIAGHRRVAAVRELGWEQIDVIEHRDFDGNDEVIAAQYAENTQRLDLTDWEKLQVAYDLKLEGLNQGDISDVLGISKAKVSKAHKVVKSLRADDSLDDAVASRFTAEALFELADSAIPEHANDVLNRILEGDSREVWNAIRDVEHDLALIAFYEEIGPLQKEWSEAGIQVTTSNPKLHHGKTNQWNQPVDDRKVERIDSQGSFGLDIKLEDHISLDCHMIWISDGSESYGHSPSVTHWCMNKGLHTAKGKSDVKTVTADKDQERREQLSVERKTERALKQQRRDQAAIWLKKVPKQSDVVEFAVELALQNGWREDSVRTACDVLDLSKDRPKGAEFDWYSKALQSWLTDRFGDSVAKANVWKIRLMQAQRYIDQMFPSELVKGQLENVEVTL